MKGLAILRLTACLALVLSVFPAVLFGDSIPATGVRVAATCDAAIASCPGTPLMVGAGTSEPVIAGFNETGQTAGLGFAVVAGDVLIFDGSSLGDLLRFTTPPTGNSSAFLYSDQEPGKHNLKDVDPSKAFPLQPITFPLQEGSKGPTLYRIINSKLPKGRQTVAVYAIFSDPVPEPGTLVLLGLGALALASRLRRKRSKSAS